MRLMLSNLRKGLADNLMRLGHTFVFGGPAGRFGLRAEAEVDALSSC